MTAELRAAMGAAAVAAAQAVGYVGAGTVEFIADGEGGPAGGRLLVHGDEHAPAGRASGDRGGHRARSGRMAVPRRRGRAAAAQAGSGAHRRSRGRGAPLCRGSGARLSAVDRQIGGAAISAGRRPARRYRRRSRRRGHAVLRSDDRQADRAWRQRANRRSIGWRMRWTAPSRSAPRSNVGFLAALARAPGFRAGDFDTGFIDRNLVAARRRAATARSCRRRLRRRAAHGWRTRPHRVGNRTRSGDAHVALGHRRRASSSPANARWRCRCSPTAKAWSRRWSMVRTTCKSPSTAPRPPAMPSPS